MRHSEQIRPRTFVRTEFRNGLLLDAGLIRLQALSVGTMLWGCTWRAQRPPELLGANPDESTILHFRHLLEQNEIARKPTHPGQLVEGFPHPPIAQPKPHS